MGLGDIMPAYQRMGHLLTACNAALATTLPRSTYTPQIKKPTSLLYSDMGPLINIFDPSSPSLRKGHDRETKCRCQSTVNCQPPAMATALAN